MWVWTVVSHAIDQRPALDVSPLAKSQVGLASASSQPWQISSGWIDGIPNVLKVCLNRIWVMGWAEDSLYDYSSSLCRKKKCFWAMHFLRYWHETIELQEQKKCIRMNQAGQKIERRHSSRRVSGNSITHTLTLHAQIQWKWMTFGFQGDYLSFY